MLHLALEAAATDTPDTAVLESIVIIWVMLMSSVGCWCWSWSYDVAKFGHNA
jgi:hypothetical protein